MDDFQRKIQRLADNISSLGGRHPVTEILSPEFMSAHTSYGTFEEMCAAVGVTTAEEFTAMPDTVWEAHVRAHTQFPSWEAMQKAGGEAWAKRRLLDGLK